MNDFNEQINNLFDGFTDASKGIAALDFDRVPLKDQANYIKVSLDLIRAIENYTAVCGGIIIKDAFRKKDE